MPPVDGAHALKRKLVWEGGGGAAGCILPPPPFILAQIGLVTGRAREGSSYILGSCGSILAMGSMGNDHVGTVGVLCTGKPTRFPAEVHISKLSMGKHREVHSLD